MVPNTVPVPVVSDLKATVQGDSVTLTWTVPQIGPQAPLAVAGFFMNRSKTPISEADCKNCPVLFQRIADLVPAAAGAEDPAVPGMTYTEPVERGFRYIYKVTAYTSKDDPGQDSNLVEFIH